MLASTALISVEEALMYLDRPIGDDPLADESRASKLEFMINGISTYYRKFLDRPLRTETITEVLDGNGSRALMLTHYPIVSVDALSTDDGYVTTILDPATELFLYADIGKILLKDDAQIGVFERCPQLVTVTYKAGYADSVENVPWDLKQATVEAIRHLYVKEYGAPSTIFGDDMIPKYMSSKMPGIVKEYLMPYKRTALEAI